MEEESGLPCVHCGVSDSLRKNSLMSFCFACWRVTHLDTGRYFYAENY